MESGSRFVEDEKSRFRIFPAGLREFSEMADQFEPLAFSAGKGVDWLPEAKITEPYFLKQSEALDRFSRRTGIAQAIQKIYCFIDRSFKHIRDAPGNLISANPGRKFNFQDVRAIAASVAIRAANVNVAQKLHFNFFEARPSAFLALPLRGVEAEGAAGEAALARRLNLRKKVTKKIKCTDVNRRV